MTDLVLDLGFHPVLLSAGGLSRTAAYAPRSRQAFIIHQEASQLYAQAVEESLRAADKYANIHLVRLLDGEKAKELAEIERLYDQALEARLERSAAVYAVGGGCVGDAAGFFAATYLRGLPLVHVPTTLLAQVDSSIGGKVGVNLGKTKNMVGAFYLPKLVVDDIATLSSLPDAQISNGLAEAVKYGLILDADFLHYLESHMDRLRAKDAVALRHVVQQSVMIKGAVVATDPHESGDRMKLNYGHTLGHGIETVTGLPHGFAVSVGMHAAGLLAVEKGLLKKSELERQNHILQAAGLPLTAKADADAVMEKVLNDKKRAEGTLRMVLLDRPGSCRVFEVTLKEAKAALEQVLQ